MISLVKVYTNAICIKMKICPIPVPYNYHASGSRDFCLFTEMLRNNNSFFYEALKDSELEGK